MKKNKASFRALRDDCGLTQQDVADYFGVRVLSVKRWENDKEPSQPPDDVWEWIVDLNNAITAEAQMWADKVITMADEEDNNDPIYIAYYRTQDDLDRFGKDDRPYSLVNTISRKAASIIEAAGYDVQFAYKA